MMQRKKQPRRPKPPKPNRREALPPADPGTLRHYFELHYYPERMLDCKPTSVAEARRSIRALRDFMDGDVRIDKLTESQLALFFQSLRDAGRPATTVNGHRARLLAIANHAYNAGLLARPLRVRKLKEVRNPPCAWTVNELRQILAAARMFREGWNYGTPSGGRIRCNRFWEALLLVAYETAMRRGALLAIRQTDVDLSTGWLVVDGSSSKTLKGQSYKLSDNTIAALKKIWKPARKLIFAYASMAEIDRHFNKILEASGVRRTRSKGMNKFHAIRRTAATMVCQISGIGAAASLLGHSSAEVTRRNYVDPTQIKHDVTEVLPSLAANNALKVAAVG